MSTVPLIIDLDGTFIHSDTTHELCILHLKHSYVVGFFQLLFWFLKSKSEAKHRLATLYADKLSIDRFPYSDLASSDTFKKAQMRILVSGSDDRIVQKVADTSGQFAWAKGTDLDHNLISAQKANFLKQRFPDGFDYVGNSEADIEVWKYARNAYGYNVSQSVMRQAKTENISLDILAMHKSPLKGLLKGMRLHQWSKNGLLIVIPFLNLALFESVWLLYLAVAFIAFGLVASATYLLNDLVDLFDDRAHPTKCKRPFASGALSIPFGVMAIVGLAGTGFGLASWLDPIFASILLVYTFISISYSFWLKKIAVLDALVLSFLFCWRILAGCILLGLTANAWFMFALGFFFFSLALGKRAIELANSKAGQSQIRGRGYHADDYIVVLVSGLASSFVSIIVVLIYALLSASTVIEREINVILIIAALAFWQVRFWLLVGRNQVHDDPIVFALKDKVSAATLVFVGCIVMFEQLYPIGGQ